MPIEHAPSPTTLADLAHASPDSVMVAPRYRGYADSQGTVRGILGDTEDANNAITHPSRFQESGTERLSSSVTRWAEVWC